MPMKYRYWSDTEKNIMFEFVFNYKKENPRMNWVQLSQQLPGRTPRQCYRQYCRLQEKERAHDKGVNKKQYKAYSFIVDDAEPTKERSHRKIITMERKDVRSEESTDEMAFTFSLFDKM